MHSLPFFADLVPKILTSDEAIRVIFGRLESVRPCVSVPLFPALHNVMLNSGNRLMNITTPRCRLSNYTSLQCRFAAHAVCDLSL
jgi:hypothetical protein